MRAIYFDSCGPKAHRSQWLFDFDLCSNVAIVDFFMKYRRYVYESVNTSTTNVIKEMPFMRVLLCTVLSIKDIIVKKANIISIQFVFLNVIFAWIEHFLLVLRPSMEVIFAACFVVIHWKIDNPFIWSFGSYLIQFFRPMVEQQWLVFYAFSLFLCQSGILPMVCGNGGN